MAGRRRFLSALFAAICATSCAASPEDAPPSTVPPDVDPRAYADPISAEHRNVAERRRPVGAAPTIRIRLRGLDPRAPWTSKVVLNTRRWDIATQEAREDHLEVDLDADGVARFALPAWRETAVLGRSYFFADDRHYTTVLKGAWTCEPEETVFDVEPRGVITGRVVDAQGAPRPGALLFVAPVHRVVPATAHFSTQCDAAGVFVLQLAPNAGSLLIAHDPEHASALLASMRVDPTIGPPLHVPDLVIGDGVVVEGTVRWTNGEPIEHAKVQLVGARGTPIVLEKQGFEETSWPGWDERRRSAWIGEDGSGGCTATVVTDAAGHFVLRTPTAQPVDVALVSVARATLHGEMRRTVTTSQRADFELPLPVVVRTTVHGKEKRGASIEIESGGHFRSRGALVLLRPARIRATLDDRRSAWLDLALDRIGTEVDLPLVEALTKVTLAFDREPRRRELLVHCRREDGARVDAGTTTLFLPPGRWRLSVQAIGYRADAAPFEVLAEVGATPLVVPAPFVAGGWLNVDPRDFAGRWVAGTCHAIDGAGRVIAAPFWHEPRSTSKTWVARHTWPGDVGELLPGVNKFGTALAPGDYELVFDFVGYGKHSERVTIRAGETTEVKLQLGP